MPPLSFSVRLQSLLLLGCFALFWSLYYTLEVALAHLDLRELWRGRRGRAQDGFQAVRLEEGPEMELQLQQQQRVADTVAKAPLITADSAT